MPPITASLKRVGPSFIIPTSKRPPVVDEASCTNVTFSTLTNPDGDGKNYRLAVWNSNGNFVLTRGGVVQAHLIQGGWNGGGGTNNTGVGGPGGKSLPLEALLLDPGTIAITVGAGAVADYTSIAGGHSSIGSTSTSDSRALSGGLGGNRGVDTNPLNMGSRGIPSRITGSEVFYAGGGGSGGGSSTNGSQSRYGSSNGGADGYSSVNPADGQAGSANTGGGGGGFWNVGTYKGGAGGSGKVMVRWEV